MQALKHPTADALTQNVHESATTASNIRRSIMKSNHARFQGIQLKKERFIEIDKTKKAAIASFSVSHEYGQFRLAYPIYPRLYTPVYQVLREF